MPGMDGGELPGTGLTRAPACVECAFPSRCRSEAGDADLIAQAMRCEGTLPPDGGVPFSRPPRAITVSVEGIVDKDVKHRLLSAL